MKALRNGIMALAALAAAASCGDSKDKAQQEERTVAETDSATGITALRDYTLKDTVTIGGRVYRYTCSLQHVDTMPTLINSQGAEYKESRVVISVSRDSSQVFNKTYYKKDFSSIIPDELAKVSTVVGVNYNYLKSNDHTALHFIVTVGDPDETSDVSMPLEITVAPDGSSSVSKAENVETAPLSDGYNKEPQI